MKKHATALSNEIDKYTPSVLRTQASVLGKHISDIKCLLDEVELSVVPSNRQKNISLLYRRLEELEELKALKESAAEDKQSKVRSYSKTGYSSSTPVDFFCSEGELVRSFDTLDDAIQAIGAPKVGCIAAMTSNKVRYGYRWREGGKFKSIPPLKKSLSPVRQYDKNTGEFIKEFSSTRSASYQFKGDNRLGSSIKFACDNKVMRCGFYWRYRRDFNGNQLEINK